MEDDVMVKSFDQVVTDLKQATDDINSRIRSNYITMIKYYIKAGDGAISKYAGVIITQDLINVLMKRYLELGGKYEDIIDIEW